MGGARSCIMINESFVLFFARVNLSRIVSVLYHIEPSVGGARSCNKFCFILCTCQLSLELSSMENYFSEVNELWPGQAFSLKIEKELYHQKSKYQDIRVIKRSLLYNIYMTTNCIINLFYNLQ